MLVGKQSGLHFIDRVNWPESFPYRPSVWFEISLAAHDSLVLHYHVLEDGVCARCAADRDPVWEDSCVEFFFAPKDDGMYFNVECNCVGKLYMCCGSSREGRVFLPESAYAAISREASLGTEAFGVREEKTAWDVRLVIPASVFALESYAGLHARGNFYKCGFPRHYLSWAPVDTPGPDFHRPEFFRNIDFEF